MSDASSRRFLLMLCGWATLAAAGCSDWDMPSWVPFQGPAADTVAGVTAPHDRIEKLQKLSETAGSMTPEQRRQISEELAVTIKTEKDVLIRREIIRTLDKYPSPAGDVILQAALKDPESIVRIVACEAWGHRTENPQAVVLLSESLRSDADFDVRLAAAKALGETKNVAAKVALGEALADPDPAMQYQAIVALQKATGQNFGNSVERGQLYVKGETPQPAPSLAERFFKLF
jgi:HEAT repeat protein